ncbi:hypothetical protein SAMN04487948_11070 [Halogranum amylolyticum]|uniref:Amidohydrolase-related domain-containing protein n=1 Tax=Halogranum amylolyticum TaxID=660520 RepID=A0A1H8UAZ3_9EURY|nr:amidohydrolase family protein [Halogranum amylolyticum]SEP00345.1 hypothetical protein SAMN04487948_11070 [Halogranum amylolyticum]
MADRDRTPPDGVIDTHVHMNPFWRLNDDARSTLQSHSANFEEKRALAKNPDEFVAYLDSQGVAMAAIINYVTASMGYTHDTNEWAAEFRDSHPDRIMAFGGFDPRLTDDPEGVVERAVDDLQLDGIKIHPPHQGLNANDYRDDPDTRGLDGLRILYERCESAGVPVMVHTGTSIFPSARSRYADPMPLDDVAVDFPDLPLIMAHGGRPMYTDEAWFLLFRHDNVYLDISSFPPQNLLDYFPDIEQVSGRVLFGSDWPGPMVPDIGDNVEAVKQLDLPDDVVDSILRGTAEELYNL